MVFSREATALLILGGLVSAPAFAQQYTISTFAGGGPQPSALGTGFISSIITDGTGNVYFSSAYYPCACVFKLGPNGNLTHIAGGAQAGFAGDGGPAAKALLNDPVGLAVDSVGNLFIAEGVLYNWQGGYSRHSHKLSPRDGIFTPQGGYRERVRKVSPSGIINTVAGGGVQGYSGDGGPATGASFFGLSSIAVDAAGNLYIADGLVSDGDGGTAGNNRIRKVTPDGIITTVAGTGDQGYSGDGGPAVNAQINGPWGLTVDSADNLFFSDFYNSRIRELSVDGAISTVVDLASQVPSCVFNPNSYDFCSAYSTALDPSGNLVFSNCDCNGWPPNYPVLTRSPNGAITILLGNNIALEIGVAGPIAIDAAGNLWFAGGWPGSGPSLRKISPDGTRTVAVGDGACCDGGDGGPAASAQFQHANGVAADASGNLFIADANNHRLREVMPGGIITTVAGSGGLNVNCDVLSAGTFSPAIATELCLPSQVAADVAGSIYIVDRNRIRKVSPDGTITSIAGDGTAGISSDGGLAAQTQLAYPNSVAVDSAGNVYFAEWSRVRKITPDGIVITVAGGTARAGSSNCSPPGSPGCGPPPVGDGQPAVSVQLFGPIGLALDSAGNLYFVDGPRIRKVTPDGIISTVVGNGNYTGYHGPTGDGGPATSAPLWSPNGVTVDSAGNLYISEAVRIRKVTTDGIIHTIAGTQEPGYSGDNGPATNAQLWNPTGLTVDGAGNVYFADSFNNVIRVLRPAR